MNKRLSLKKETLAVLDNGELADVVAGTATWTCTAGCTVTNGDSCGGVCSGYCPSHNCVAAVTAVVSTLPNTIL